MTLKRQETLVLNIFSVFIGISLALIITPSDSHAVSLGAILRSSHCGNLKCEPRKGEDSFSCAIDCSTSPLHSYNYQTVCRTVTQIGTPETAEEVQVAVLDAIIHGRTFRAIGSAHSANSTICSEGDVISTSRLNRIIGLESFNGEETVVLEPGVKLGQLVDWLHARNLALGYAFPNYREVTIAGAISTGSHGSSRIHSASITSLMRSADVINARGELVHYSAAETKPELWQAAHVSLGALGVVTRLRLKVVPQFNVEMAATFHHESYLFGENETLTLGAPCDYDQIVWFPSKKYYMRICGRETQKSPDLEPRNMFLFQSKSQSGDLTRRMLHFGRFNHTLNKFMESVRYSGLRKAPPFQKKDANGVLWRTGQVVGPSHHVLISGATPGQQFFTATDWEVAIPAAKAGEALHFVRDYMHRNRISLPIFGVILRFVPSERVSLMAHTATQGLFKENEPALIVEFPVYDPGSLTPLIKDFVNYPYENLIRELIVKFQARPHWGKNSDRIFEFATQHDVFGSNLDLFEQEVKLQDPNGTFLNPLLSSIFSVRKNR